jgi:hypothetical protein
MSMRALFTLQDLIRILNYSEATLRRYIADARLGIGNFPLPVNDGFKRKLLFRPEDIESWIAASRQQQPVQNIESASQRSKRHTAAMKSLKLKGVKIND